MKFELNLVSECHGTRDLTATTRLETSTSELITTITSRNGIQRDHSSLLNSRVEASIVSGYFTARYLDVGVLIKFSMGWSWVREMFRNGGVCGS